MSRAVQNRSPLTDAASISSATAFENFGLTAASSVGQRVDLRLQALGMAARRRAEFVLRRRRPDARRLLRKARRILQVAHQRQHVGAEQIEAMAVAVGLGQGEHDAARGQREDQDARKIAKPNRMNELSIIRHAQTPATERNFTGFDYALFTLKFRSAVRKKPVVSLGVPRGRYAILTILNPSTSLTTGCPFQRSISCRMTRFASSPPIASFILSMVFSCSQTLPTALLSGT